MKMLYIKWCKSNESTCYDMKWEIRPHLTFSLMFIDSEFPDSLCFFFRLFITLGFIILTQPRTAWFHHENLFVPGPSSERWDPRPNSRPWLGWRCFPRPEKWSQVFVEGKTMENRKTLEDSTSQIPKKGESVAVWTKGRLIIDILNQYKNDPNKLTTADNIYITGLSIYKHVLYINFSLPLLFPTKALSKTRNSSTNLAVQLWFSMKMTTLQSGSTGWSLSHPSEK